MRILSDDAFVTSPINSAMNYTWAALSASWKNTLIVAVTLILLSILQMVPLIGFIASFVQAIVLYALGYWVVDRLKESAGYEAFKTQIAGENFKAMMGEFFAPASGFYVGFFIFSLIMMALTAFLFWITGGFDMIAAMQSQTPAAQASPEQVYAFYAQILGTSSPALLFVLITSLFFSYLWPLVYGYALLQRTFTDAFNAVFMFFSTRFWKAAFRGAYFKIVSLWMLILLGTGILMGLCIGIVILLPLGIVILLWMLYFTAIVSAETYNLSDDI
ncbi:hypothetical protein [Hydrogenimonas urashimensis]|uniref:hypothetical protein n=1 Tax=Hydrogenimonas urashimensis TaxID=2740515 RepID=UPI001916B5BB|nr:hypothetical protein [Hydrogenimonas urashimensis]